MQAHINLAENGLFIFENVSSGTEVGIDYHSWHVGPTFRGISNIPPGFHFIFFSSVDKHKQYSPRTGFFIFVKPSDVIVRRYDKESEDFVDEDVNVEKCLHSKYLSFLFRNVFTQPVVICSKLAIETIEQNVKYVQTPLASFCCLYC